MMRERRWCKVRSTRIYKTRRRFWLSKNFLYCLHAHRRSTLDQTVDVIFTHVLLLDATATHGIAQLRSAAYLSILRLQYHCPTTLWHTDGSHARQGVVQVVNRWNSKHISETAELETTYKLSLENAVCNVSRKPSLISVCPPTHYHDALLSFSLTPI